MSKYGNTVFYDFKSRIFFIFSSNYRHALVLKIPFPSHMFPKISKYLTKNLHFPSTSKYYAPPSPPPSSPPFAYWQSDIFLLLYLFLPLITHQYQLKDLILLQSFSKQLAMLIQELKHFFAGTSSYISRRIFFKFSNTSSNNKASL